MKQKVFRNACPRNCYSTCSIVSYVENDKLIKITGDKENHYTDGRLCAKGYSYTEYVYNEKRLKSPILQSPRGSGNWKKISWDEAYTIIAKKIIELNERYQSNLSLAYSKFSGNLGFLNSAIEGMFNSIGPHTKPIGNVCLATGASATSDTFGKLISAIPEHMAHSKAVVIWGSNPAVTNVHQMKFIYEARNKGAILVVIDPIFTSTAEKADLYIQINPGTDGMLALGVTKLLLQNNKNQVLNELNYLTNNAEQFISTIIKHVDLKKVCEITGVTEEALQELANIYSSIKPIATWNGFGLQRNKFGSKSIKFINSLVTISGNMYEKYGGIYYAHEDLNHFPRYLYNFPEKKHPTINRSREININNFPVVAKTLTDPPLKFLWIASRNTFAQDQHFNEWRQLLDSLELIVTVDLFMTSTAKQSDIVLPATSHFEEDDLNISYWNHWLSINQKAIPAFHEAKSDLQIARELMAKLNELSPNFSTFPSDLEPIDWIKKELTPHVKNLYGIESYKDLLTGPKHKINFTSIPSNKQNRFSFVEKNYVTEFLNDIEITSKKDSQYPFRLITPQALLKLHSQFSTVTWLHDSSEQTIVELNEDIASKLKIFDGDNIKIYNSNGTVFAVAKINRFIPNNVVLVEQTSSNSINQLVGCKDEEVDINKSTNFYDCYVNIAK